MKKIKKINLLLSLFTILSLTSCGSDPVEPTPVSPDPTPVEPTPSEKDTKKYPERDIDYPTEIEKFNEDSIQIHYQRKDNSYASWTLWLWNPDGNDDSVEDNFNYQDDYGVIASYPLSHFGVTEDGRLGLIVKKVGIWTKDGTDEDRFVDFSKYTKDENNVYHIYLVGGDANIYKNKDLVVNDEIYQAAFTSAKSITISCSGAVETYKVYKDGELVDEGKGAGRKTFPISLKEEASFASKYEVEVIFRVSGNSLKTSVLMTGLYSTDSFNNLYYYDGELGAIYSETSTTFKVWSPVSEKIVLKVYESGTPVSISKSLGNDSHLEYEMIKKEKGVFESTVLGDLEGKYYTYTVYSSNYPDGKEIVDPYAKSAGISGLRGMVVNFDKTNPENWDNVKSLGYEKTNLTVYELHVSDVTSSLTWNGNENNRKKYLGLIESGTTYKEGNEVVKTGFDHIKELGVNAIQIQPIFDQANDETTYTYNWGYNPLNYNVLEGMYSSNAYDGYARISEFKKMIQAYNESGIEIIMDVVYNHVNGVTNSNFDVLMPNYYFRYKTTGALSNGSGCGNETASENKMMRKFIIDSTKFWINEYKLDGFRFDLMGLHDIETMNEISSELTKINPNIVLYGEPWTGGTSTLAEASQAKQVNANKLNGVGQFNDQMRDALIKGGLSGISEKGWVTDDTLVSNSDVTKIVAGLNGITASTPAINNPYQTVNYVTCHDNYTLYDRIKAAGIEDEDIVKKMAVLANSVVFTSKGTTFMLAGEEFLRTKQGNSNSYNAGDEINEFNYSLKIKNNDVFENYKKLISFKQNLNILSSKDNDLNIKNIDGGAVISYTCTDNNHDYLVIHTNGVGAKSKIDVSSYSELYLDTLGIYDLSKEIIPQKYQTLIYKK